MDPTTQNIYISRDVIFDETGESSTSPSKIVLELDSGPIRHRPCMIVINQEIQ